MTDSTYAARLAAALEDAITRNPLLSKDEWARYSALIAEYNASVATRGPCVVVV